MSVANGKAEKLSEKSLKTRSRFLPRSSIDEITVKEVIVLLCGKSVQPEKLE
ncbi:hypothetical protein M7I_4113 [Glarea lozoyensis 74030]|uniref:Uncharacterized protein n=1 Tax=Glarea lozoyensis (strain ATCC 74030 / MF5533) TaxID=1104152 RepID=H0ENB0_GLAL7|nr:hypothetical protein M7I_4113 [Glarea lozoyensis 74030]